MHVRKPYAVLYGIARERIYGIVDYPVERKVRGICVRDESIGYGISRLIEILNHHQTVEHKRIRIRLTQFDPVYAYVGPAVIGYQYYPCIIIDPVIL